MATITKTNTFLRPVKPKYMRWKKWYQTKEYKDWAVTTKTLSKLINNVEWKDSNFNAQEE